MRYYLKDLDFKDLRIMRSMYWEQMAAVRLHCDREELDKVVKVKRPNICIAPLCDNLTPEALRYG